MKHPPVMPTNMLLFALSVQPLPVTSRQRYTLPVRRLLFPDRDLHHAQPGCVGGLVLRSTKSEIFMELLCLGSALFLAQEVS